MTEGMAMKKTLECGPYTLEIYNRTHIMGILNVTPDSFSDGGKFHQWEEAVKHAEQMVRDGADIIDVGGESTRPGHAPISAKEEIERLGPVIKEISKNIHVPISIDTYKAETAQYAIDQGAHIINDIWGAKKDPEIADVAKENQVPIILTHNRPDMNYRSFLRDCLYDLYESINIAKKAGVLDEQIILDPGIGFAKTQEQNIEMLRNLDKVAALGYPLLLGTSRKSVIGYILELPVEERLEGTGATICYGIMKGVHIVRVHDVKPMARMVKVMDTLVQKGMGTGDKMAVRS